MEQEFKKTLEVEIQKRKQLSIEARVMFADVKKCLLLHNQMPVMVSLSNSLIMISQDEQKWKNC